MTETKKTKRTAQPIVDFEVGKNYLVRSVTHYHTGHLVAVTERALILEQAAWIADTGRYAPFLATGKLDSAAEVEPYPDGVRVIVLLGAVIDACQWPHELPRVQK